MGMMGEEQGGDVQHLNAVGLFTEVLAGRRISTTRMNTRRSSATFSRWTGSDLFLPFQRDQYTGQVCQVEISIIWTDTGGGTRGSGAQPASAQGHPGGVAESERGDILRS